MDTTGRPAPPRRRPVVLLHGTRMTGAQWEPYQELMPGIPLLAPDLPGHGERVGEEFTGEAALATVDAAVQRARALGRGAPVLAGHSLGGYLAMLWAARRREGTGEVAALVPIGACADPRGPLTGVYRGFARWVERTDTDRLAHRMNRLMRLLGARGEHADRLPDGSAYASLPAAWSLVIDHAGPHLLAEVDCPVLLVNGALDQMRLHVARYADAARSAGVPVEVALVPWATHLMPMTHPEPLARLLVGAVDLADGCEPGSST